MMGKMVELIGTRGKMIGKSYEVDGQCWSLIRRWTIVGELVIAGTS